MTAEEYEFLPDNVKLIVDSWDDNKDLYKECARIKTELEAIGWTCDYGLDGMVYDVMKIKEFMDVLTIKDFDDVVTDEDGHKWSQVCVGHAEQMTSECDVQPYGSGICGVEGCDVESEHYIDF